MSQIIYLDKINEIYVRVNIDTGQSMELYSFFSVYVPNFQYNPKFQQKIWNGKVSFFDSRTRMLPIGLLPEFDRFCKQFGYTYKFNFPINELRNSADVKDVEDFCDFILQDNDEISVRDFQLEAIHNSIENKRGVILSPTGSGKSLIIYLTLRLLLVQDTTRKAIIVVPNISLVNQMFSDFKEYGWDELYDNVGKLYSGQNPDYSKRVLITTWQSIYKKPEKFFREYGVLMVDEVHSAKAVSVQSIAKNCVNAEYRIGYTGTLPTHEADKKNIHGFLGPTIFSLKSKELIDRGILSKIKIVNMILTYPPHVIKKNQKRPYPEEVNTIIEYEKRNIVFDDIFEKIPDGQNTLILCERIKHLESIQEYLEELLPEKFTIENIYSKTKPTERETIRKYMDENNNVVLVGTYATMGTGVNIRRIHNVIFASSYKSKIKILQSIGRGLRKHESKDGVIIWDAVDSLVWEGPRGAVIKNHVYRHWEERLKYYEDQGFEYITKKMNI